METMTKPARVEVGQRYIGRFTKQVFTVLESLGHERWLVEYDDGDRLTYGTSEIHGQYGGAYLGPAVPPVMPAKAVCPSCDDEVSTAAGHWECSYGGGSWIACSHEDPKTCGNSHKRFVEAPRPTAPLVSVPATVDPRCALCGYCGSNIGSHSCIPGASGTTTRALPQRPKPLRYEVRASENGQALARVGNVTALQLIQARKKPEPWVPSVDEVDLLPDAGR